MIKTIRLNKFIANSGFASRRQADVLIAAGKVTVNGILVTEMGTQVNASKDKIVVSGTELSNIKPEPRFVIFNKPAGILSSRVSQGGVETVYDYLAKKQAGVEDLDICGRLDKDSCGLMLLTNDGELLHDLTHPSIGIVKTYEVHIKGALTFAQIKQMKEGVVEGEELLACAWIKAKRISGSESVVSCGLREGKKRHLRRMFKMMRRFVIALKRTQIGYLQLGDLPDGDFRTLNKNEVQSLRLVVR